MQPRTRVDYTLTPVPDGCTTIETENYAYSITCVEGENQFKQSVTRSFRLGILCDNDSNNGHGNSGGHDCSNPSGYSTPVSYTPGVFCPAWDPWGIINYNDSHKFNVSHPIWTVGSHIRRTNVVVANIKLNDLDNPMTTRPEYGSREYYSEMFSDIICDTGCYETVEENYETVMKIMGGFQDAIESWLNYHRVAACSFEDLRDEFHRLLFFFSQA